MRPLQPFFNAIKPSWEAQQNNKKEFRSLIQQIKKSGAKKDFDCIIGMSGGIISSYLVYLAKVELGLNPLIFMLMQFRNYTGRQ